MDYKEKYEQALERARNIRFGNPQSATANTVCEEIFPELKESEDERIRKAILALVTQSGHILSPMNQKSMIGWLKKQGGQKSTDKVGSKLAWSEEDEKILNSIIEDVTPCGECPDYPTVEEREYFYGGDRKVKWLEAIKEKMKGE